MDPHYERLDVRLMTAGIRAGLRAICYSLGRQMLPT